MAQAGSSSTSKENGSVSSSNGAAAGRSVVVGVATGAAGLVGGAVLGALLGSKPKRILGVRVPGSGRGLEDVVKQAGKAGKQFKNASREVGQLTSEVQAARGKVQELRRTIT
jgi:hypothetical protein